MASPKKAFHENFDTDYVIVYRFVDSSEFPQMDNPFSAHGATGKEDARQGFEKLVQSLAKVGLSTEVRNGEKCSLLVFVRIVSDERLQTAVYRAR